MIHDRSPRKHATKEGFTLIELLLAMAFFAGILMLCTALFISMLATYNKGLSIKQMDNAARSLSDDIVRTSHNATKQYEKAVDRNCIVLGDTAYIWTLPGENTGYRYDSGSKEQVAFGKGVANLCSIIKNTTDNNYYVDRQAVTSLLGDNLRVYSFSIDGSSNLASLKIVFGTYNASMTDSNPSLVSGQFQCPAAPSVGAYCAFLPYENVIYFPNTVGEAL